jgi:hypothetical protein
VQGIANRLVKAALKEATRKREVRYRDLRTIDRAVRRHFHDDISVVVAVDAATPRSSTRAATVLALQLTSSPPIPTSLQSPSYLIGALGSELVDVQVSSFSSW